MSIDIRPFFAIWVVLAAVVIALLVWRQVVARNEDDTIHVSGGGAAQQTVVATQLEKIDKWGKLLTIIAVVYGLIIAAIYGYQFWVSSGNIPTGV